jgi:hypothetical protein
MKCHTESAKCGYSQAKGKGKLTSKRTIKNFLEKGTVRCHLTMVRSF